MTLEALTHMPDGTLHEEQTAHHTIRVVKHANEVHVYFVNADGSLDGPMSRVALDRPLELAAPYLQALVLTLLWEAEPARVCVLGFAGGRLPLLLHHHLPEVVVDSVDIDAAFGPIAARYFGVRFDARQRLHIGDARAFLAAAPPAAYDIVIMDAFGDAAAPLLHLATAEFYALAARALTPGGVFAANLLRSDPHFPARLRTLLAGWPHAAVWQHKRSVVAFASQRPLGHNAVQRAGAIQRQLGLAVPLTERAAALVPATQIAADLRALLRAAPLLTDQKSPASGG